MIQDAHSSNGLEGEALRGEHQDHRVCLGKRADNKALQLDISFQIAY